MGAGAYSVGLADEQDLALSRTDAGAVKLGELGASASIVTAPPKMIFCPETLSLVSSTVSGRFTVVHCDSLWRPRLATQSSRPFAASSGKARDKLAVLRGLRRL